MQIFFKKKGIRLRKKIFYEVMSLDYIITSTYTMYRPILYFFGINDAV